MHTFRIKLFAVVCCLMAINSFSQNNYPTDSNGDLILTQTKFRLMDPDVDASKREYTQYLTQAQMYTQTGVTDNTEMRWDVITVNDTPVVALEGIGAYLGMYNNPFAATAYNWKFNDYYTTSGGVTSRTTGSFSYNFTKPLYNINNINLTTVPGGVYRNGGFNYSHTNITADSIVYVLNSDSLHSISKTKTGSSNTITFTAAELSVLTANTKSSFSILVYNTSPAIINNKKYYFINNSNAVVTPITIY